jgi:prepilin-type N-terminal cleavage/methylation domain-containing protein
MKFTFDIVGGRQLRASRGARQRGFSLLELIVVVSILMILAATAVPNLMNVVANMRLRGAASSLSGLVQECRIQAIKHNKPMTVLFVSVHASPYAFVQEASSSNTALGTVNPLNGPIYAVVQLGAPVIQVTTPTGGSPTPLTSTTLGYTPLDLTDATNLPSFNSRGVPCKYSGGSCANNGFVYYFTDIRRGAAWTALTISPAGRIQRWFWYGDHWGN